MPHTGGAYSFARTAFGPWAGFLTGLAENVEYVITPAVIVFFIGSYAAAILGAPAETQPLFWIAFYIIFVTLNYVGVELSFRFSLIITVLALAVPCRVQPQRARPHRLQPLGAEHRARRHRAAGAATDRSCLGSAATVSWPRCPFAVWLFLAIEQLPLAAEESVDPKRDMPKGIMAGMFTLLVSAFLILTLNPSVQRRRVSHKLGASGEPLLDGFRALYGTEIATILAIVALTGLIASFHTIIYAYGRQIYSLSRAGYFPTCTLRYARRTQDPAHRTLCGCVCWAWRSCWPCGSPRAPTRAPSSSAARCSTWRCSAPCCPTSCRA